MSRFEDFKNRLRESGVSVMCVGSFEISETSRLETWTVSGAKDGAPYQFVVELLGDGSYVLFTQTKGITIRDDLALFVYLEEQEGAVIK